MSRLALLSCVLVLAGCDAAVRGTQSIRIGVFHTQDGKTEAFSNAVVRCANARHYRRYTRSRDAEKQAWANKTFCEPATTDDFGLATLTVPVGCLYGGYMLLAPPKAPRDGVTGKEYLFRIEHAEFGRKEVVVQMNEPAKASVGRLALVILKIGEPVTAK